MSLWSNVCIHSPAIAMLWHNNRKENNTYYYDKIYLSIYYNCIRYYITVLFKAFIRDDLTLNIAE